ncbi:chitinase-like protein 3 [Argonauta hians]
MKLPVALLLIVGMSSTEVQGSKKVFCYYSSFAQTRQGIGKFLPENIDPFLCTHVIYAFVDISDDGRSLRPFNWNDITPGTGLYARTLALKKKNPKLKILLAVGGWIIGSEPFIPMVASEYNRRIWINNVIKYLRKYNFDGFDMDWEFPATRGSPPEDKYRFTSLMEGLYTAFKTEAEKTGQEKLLLTLATASGSHYISKSYEPHKIINYIDYMLLMTYNYHGQWEKVTGHHSGLWRHHKDSAGEKSELNTNWSIKYWLDVGIPKSKLIAGIATYGMSFTLANPSIHGLYAPAKGGGRMGRYSSEKGILSYYEVCENIREQGWKSTWIDDQEVPYAYGGDQWVGYENTASVKIKARNIITNNLAGAFVWSLEMDDFSGSCNEGKSPLMHTIRDVLQPYGPQNEKVVRVQKSSIGRMYVTSKQRSSNRPRITVKPKPAWNDKPTWKPRPTWGKLTEKPRYQANTAMQTKKPKYVTKNGSFVKPTKQPSAAGSIDCSTLGEGIYVDPASCEHFVHCIYVGGRSYYSVRMKCPAGTLFDRDLGLCNHRSTVVC